MAAIEANYAAPAWTQAMAASEQRVSPSQLSARFAKDAGVTWSKYRRRTRLERAAVLLTTTQLRIKEIWVAVGYNDGSNFCNDFRRMFSETPREYRLGRSHNLGDECRPTPR